MKQRITEIGPDVLILAGAAAVTTGAAMINEAAGWIVGGLFLVAVGVLWARGV